MKQILFFLFLLPLWGLGGLYAQSGVTVTPVSANYGNKTVTFSVSWLNNTRTGTHNSKVWVWVDFAPVTGNVVTGSWSRALVSGTPTASSGTPTRETTTDKGFWLQGTSGSSGTYNATVMVSLSNVPAKFNWCAYASDYPPNVTLDKGTYTFKGTASFLVNTHAQPVASKTITKANLTVASQSTFTDATNCPGIGSLYCPYTGSDLYMDPTHLCQQRTAGAKNWEAYIKDTRDNQIYRITQFSDNSWWFADDLASSVKRRGTCDGKSYYDAIDKADCPTGWQIPTYTELFNRWGTSSAVTNDTYGGSIVMGTFWYPTTPSCAPYTSLHNVCGVANDRYDYVLSDQTTACFPQTWACNGCARIGGRVRCFRK